MVLETGFLIVMTHVYIDGSSGATKGVEGIAPAASGMCIVHECSCTRWHFWRSCATSACSSSRRESAARMLLMNGQRRFGGRSRDPWTQPCGCCVSACARAARGTRRSERPRGALLG